jgi:regulator of protease activity HflC (stomatin/prohibitin superfamily)
MDPLMKYTFVALGLAVVAFVAWCLQKTRPTVRTGALVACVVASVAAAGLFVGSSTQQIGANKVGVVTRLGKPVDTMGSGFHWKSPLTKVTQYDAAIQTDTYSDATDVAKKNGGCVAVQLANKSRACVPVSVRWQIVPTAAAKLHSSYRGFDKVANSLVERQVLRTMSDVYGTYNPLDDLDKKVSAPSQATTDDAAQGSTEERLSRRIMAILANEVGREINIKDVLLRAPIYDAGTQASINAYQEELGRTRVAEQRLKTAQAEAKANEAVAKSLTPEVLSHECIKTWEKKGGVPPYCFTGGTALVGGGLSKQ